MMRRVMASFQGFFGAQSTSRAADGHLRMKIPGINSGNGYSKCRLSSSVCDLSFDTEIITLIYADWINIGQERSCQCKIRSDHVQK
jgi:hypothetical protein